MISSDVFAQSLLRAKVSKAEFCRKSGINQSKINSYLKNGVPDRDTENVIQMLKNAAKPIFFGKQMSIEDY